MHDLAEAMELHHELFGDRDVRRRVAGILRDRGIVNGATCTNCGFRQVLGKLDDEFVVIKCGRCETSLSIDLSLAVTSAIFHAIARSRAYRSSGQRLLRLSARLREDGPGS